VSATHEFDEVTEVTPLGDGRFAAAVADGWDIGGIPNGGYVMAIGAAAMAAACGRPDPVSINGRFLQVTRPGELEISTEVLRVGKYHTSVRATLTQGDDRPVELVGTFGDLAQAPADSPIAPAAPDLGAPGDGFPSSLNPGGAFIPPPISEKVELRMHPDSVGFALGAPTGAARMDCWARFADGRPPDPLALVLFADALPPAVFNAEVAPAWTPTVELGVQCLRRPSPGWLACSTFVSVIAGDYLTEDGMIWDGEGRLVAVSRQLAMMPRS